VEHGRDGTCDEFREDYFECLHHNKEVRGCVIGRMCRAVAPTTLRRALRRARLLLGVACGGRGGGLGGQRAGGPERWPERWLALRRPRVARASTFNLTLRLLPFADCTTERFVS